ncbi:MAG: hypothetical protein ACYC1D_04010 [Acidimicrobiales bacterium]
MRHMLGQWTGRAAAVLMLGIGAIFMTAAVPAFAAYGPTTPTVTVTPTVSPTGVVTLVVTGSGFAPNETVSLLLDNTTSLGTTPANSSGSFSDTITLPGGVTAGTHTILATGQTSGHSASTQFTLTATSVAPAVTTVSPTPAVTPSEEVSPTPSAATPSSGLAFTGADAAATAGAGALAIALGGLLVLSARRHRAGSWTK